MMKPFLVLPILLLLCLAACEKGVFSSSKQKDLEELANLKKDIDEWSSKVECTNAADWKFTPLGDKACGGPTGYVAYSTKIDEAEFLKKVKDYTDKQKAFNLKWDMVSDCMFMVPPKSIECVDGKPKLVY
ncbi:hypothetical protein WG904_00780 [Pedobacter sp. Du54]|uniref:hypothetical protein n=1 Tax=Pedobacter anseongensis TaxID=3133439 RepID=UPI0030A26197